MTFTSAILPLTLRRTKTHEELLPWLYLKGISTGDFNEALTALLGQEASGLSASTISRLKMRRAKRSLAGKQHEYLWADGLYFWACLETPAKAYWYLSFQQWKTRGSFSRFPVSASPRRKLQTTNVMSGASSKSDGRPARWSVS